MPLMNKSPHCSLMSSVGLQHAVMFLLLLADPCEGQSQVVGPSQPVMALLGDEVVLPCGLQPAASVADTDLEWSRADLEPRFVHVWHQRGDFLENQNGLFKGRTSMSLEKLERGDLSLTLSKVTIGDNGNYRCYLPETGRGLVLQLVVGSASSPLISDIEINRGQVVLTCQARGWFPAPELSWLDGEGRLLTAGPAETFRGADELFNVRSSLTAEEGDGKTFTCRAQQDNIKQSRDTLIQISASCPWQMPSIVRVVLVLAVCLMFALAVVLVTRMLHKTSANDAHLKERAVEVLKECKKSLRELQDGIRQQKEKMDKHVREVEEKVEKCEEDDYLEAKVLMNSDKAMLLQRKNEDEKRQSDFNELINKIADVLDKTRGRRSRKPGSSVL